MGVLDEKFYSTVNYDRKHAHKPVIDFSCDIIANKMNAVKRKKDKINYYNEAIDLLDSYFKKNGTTYQNGANRRVPYKIRQLVAYCYYFGVKNGYLEANSQEKFLESFGLRKNTFQKWGIQPTQILEYERWEHPLSPSSYMGIKSGNLGKSIKELEYQAGSYKVFIDMFAGSGTASTAFPANRSKHYVANELDEHQYNYLHVLNDKSLYKDFITIISEIHENMNNGVLDSRINYQQVDSLDSHKNATSTLSDFADIQQAGGVQFAVLGYWRFFRNLYMGVDINAMSIGLNWGAEIIDALSIFFLQRFAFNDLYRYSSSEIIYMNNPSYKKVNKFLKSTMEEIFNPFYKRFSLVELVNGNALNSFGLYSDKSILYYVDSPYIFTEGYNVGEFTTEDMNGLINGLMKSDQKFIFSCREGFRFIEDKDLPEDVRSVYNDKESQQLLKRYYSWICFKYIFKVFDSYGVSDTLSVCRINVKLQKNDVRKNIYKKEIEQEIMIVNYPIREIPELYSVISFPDFIEEKTELFSETEEFFEAAEQNMIYNQYFIEYLVDALNNSYSYEFEDEDDCDEVF